MPKGFNEWVKTIVQILATLIIGWILLSATERGQKMLGTEKIINEKANTDDVLRWDAALEEKIDETMGNHEKVHAVTDKYLERIMDFWDIRYEDLKDQIRDDED